MMFEIVTKAEARPFGIFNAICDNSCRYKRLLARTTSSFSVTSYCQTGSSIIN